MIVDVNIPSARAFDGHHHRRILFAEPTRRFAVTKTSQRHFGRLSVRTYSQVLYIHTVPLILYC